jgi:hypothetical protein
VSFGWLRERVYAVYLEAVARWGEWYVHPLGEDLAEVNPARRCFTKRGAKKMQAEFDACERASVEPIVTDRWETEDSIMEMLSYPVETIWVVSRWQEPPLPEVADAARHLQALITADLFHGTT